VSSRPLAAALAAGLALFASAPPAGADLTEDVDRLQRAWSDHGARIERLPPLFLEHGRTRTLKLAPQGDGEPPCVAAAVVGARTADFFVAREDLAAEAADAADDARSSLGREPPDNRLRSAGGVVVVSACGADRRKIERLRIEMSSTRATLEIVTVRFEAPLRELREILPERAAGPLAPRGDPGGVLDPRPLAERLGRAERRARADGAVQIERTNGRAHPTGGGRFDVELAPGCHRLEIMADVPAALPRRATDIDAEARDASSRVLASDHAELPDARLDFCVGDITPVAVPFRGAAGPVPVTLLHARWPMPARVPSRWGARARAGFASALLRRHAPDPPEGAVFEALGAQGTTSIPFEVVPGRCYLASLAMIRGEARSIRLAATIGDRVMRDDTVEHPESASVSFCAEAETVARLDADVRAANAFWAIAVWPMGATRP
jgi:hypothetical protein